MVANPDRQWLQVFEELKQELGISRAITLLKSGLAETPMVVGWFAPVVLVPASAFTSLSPEQMRMILAHELTHIRRYDHWVNQFQGAVEIILFFHPAMWWISRQVRIEREYCCDDALLQGTPDPKALAEALTQLELLRISNPTNALAANGGSLMDRITRILGDRVNQIKKPKEQKMKIKTLGTLVAAVMLIGSLFIVQADDKKEGKDPRAERFRAVEEKIWAAVKAGKLSKKDTGEKLAALKKEMFGGKEGHDKKDWNDKKDWDDKKGQMRRFDGRRGMRKAWIGRRLRGDDKKDWNDKKDPDIEKLKRQFEALKRGNEELRKRLEKRKNR